MYSQETKAQSLQNLPKLIELYVSETGFEIK